MSEGVLQDPACPNSARGRAYRGYRNEKQPDDGRCSWCGALRAEVFMSRLEARDVIVSPYLGRRSTSLNQLFVRNMGGESFIESFREGPRAPGLKGLWSTRKVRDVRFYLNHLSEEQCRRFAELLDAGWVRLDCDQESFRPTVLEPFRRREDRIGSRALKR